MFPFLKKIFQAKKIAGLEDLIKNAFLVDVRTPAEFSNGNVKGS